MKMVRRPEAECFVHGQQTPKMRADVDGSNHEKDRREMGEASANTVLRLGDFVCYLATLEISGRVLADGLEVQLTLQNQAAGTQTWRLESAENVVADDKNGNEISIRLQDLVLRAGANGQAMVMAVIGGQGEHVLTTENWYYLRSVC